MPAHRLTASGIERALACEASMVLPRVESVSEDSARGVAIHQFLLDVASLGWEPALEKVPAKYRLTCEAIDTTHLPVDPTKWAHEVSFSYSPEKRMAIELGRGSSARSYGGPDAIYGTEDVVGIEPDRVILVDYKTGRRYFDDVGALAAMRTYALMAARAYGRASARVIILKVAEDQRPRSIVADLTAADLAQHELDLAELWVSRARITEAPHTAIATEGEHCQFCPSFPFCPAKARLAVAMGTGQLIDEMPRIELSVDTIPALLEKLKAVKALTKHVEDAVREFARMVPVPLPDGRIYGRVESPLTVFDVEAVEVALSAMYGADVAAAAIKRTVTMEALEDALRLVKARTPGATLDGLKRTAVERLKLSGAARGEVVEKVMAHKPKARDE